MNMNQQLSEAAKAGNLQEVQRLLLEGASIDSKDDEGRIPLSKYLIDEDLTFPHDISCDYSPIAEYLIDEDLTFPHDISCDYSPIAECLINAGASIDVKNNKGCTPLHHAASCGHLPTVECLINAGASIDVKDSEGCTPLHHAASCGHLLVVEYLLKVGANYKSVTNKGMTIKEVANGKQIVDLLYEYEEYSEGVKEPDYL